MTANEKLIQKFLLGEMSGEKRFEFEEKFITDGELFEQIKLAEDELIEKYVRGWMTEAERSNFEQNFLTTDKRRERVEFSRQFIKKIETEAAVLKKNEEQPAVESESVWQKLGSLFLTPQTAVVTFAFVLTAAFGVWMLYQNFNKQSGEIVKIDNSNNENSVTPTPILSPAETPAKEVDDQKNKKDNTNTGQINSQTPTPTPTPEKIEPEKTPTPKQTPVQRTEPNPVLALFTGITRSGGKNKVLDLSGNPKRATLQLNLESTDYKIYQARLTNADGNTISQSGNLRARNSKINFTIPTENLKSGDYLIKLSGKNDAGENESVADFQFRVNQ